MPTGEREMPTEFDVQAARRLVALRISGSDAQHDDRVVKCAVAGALEGDRDALRYLYMRYADDVYGYVLRVLRDHHDAEDVTQQVFAKVMVALDRYDEREVPFSAWLLRLARNTAIDTLRRRRAIPVRDVPVAREAYEGLAALATLNAALAGLPRDQRAVVTLRHVYGLTPVEIAERMGRSTDSVHALHRRGRVALQDGLRRAGLVPSTRHRARSPRPPAEAAGEIAA
jgi:RNA polymerase sigma-70 factor (ECF subfamily)